MGFYFFPITMKKVRVYIQKLEQQNILWLRYESACLSASQMSYTASCPCLSDRRQYPTFFRTMPSDIYQARAVAQLAMRFNWTWIGAVVANNDYGHMAMKVRRQGRVRG